MRRTRGGTAAHFDAAADDRTGTIVGLGIGAGTSVARGRQSELDFGSYFEQKERPCRGSARPPGQNAAYFDADADYHAGVGLGTGTDTRAAASSAGATADASPDASADDRHCR